MPSATDHEREPGAVGRPRGLANVGRPLHGHVDRDDRPSPRRYRHQPRLRVQVRGIERDRLIRPRDRGDRRCDGGGVDAMVSSPSTAGPLVHAPTRIVTAARTRSPDITERDWGSGVIVPSSPDMARPLSAHSLPSLSMAMLPTMLTDDRRRAGWSVEQAARHLRVSVRTYRELDAGERRRRSRRGTGSASCAAGRRCSSADASADLIEGWHHPRVDQPEDRDPFPIVLPGPRSSRWLHLALLAGGTTAVFVIAFSVDCSGCVKWGVALRFPRSVRDVRRRGGSDRVRGPTISLVIDRSGFVNDGRRVLWESVESIMWVAPKWGEGGYPAHIRSTFVRPLCLAVMSWTCSMQTSGSQRKG